MRTDRDVVTTSISIKSTLLEQAKERAAHTYRTFSQYVSFLVDQDLRRAPMEGRAPEPLPMPPMRREVPGTGGRAGA